MNTIEIYLDNLKNNNLDYEMYNRYEEFGYVNKDLFKIDMDFILENFYKNVKIVELKSKRLNQTEFRKEILKKYKKCVISGNNCEYEIEGCHIIPVSDDGNYDIDNGLLLERNLHSTFDKYLWSINPNTLFIECGTLKNIGSIEKYRGKKIILPMNTSLYNNLSCHYNKFLSIHK